MATKEDTEKGPQEMETRKKAGKEPRKPLEEKKEKGPLGVWLIGARGGLATTVVVGARAISSGLASTTGLLSETDLFQGIPLATLGEMVFGGHETRPGTLYESAREIQEENGTILPHVLAALKPRLLRIDKEIRPGTLVGAGRAIEKVCAGPDLLNSPHPRENMERIREDMVSFARRKKTRRVVVVNLASTEPAGPLPACMKSWKALEKALSSKRPPRLAPSTIYAMAAFDLGFPFINFTPSRGALAPALEELAARKGVPYFGNDGKTGETLVKSALAPMFKYRNLQVLSWEGYNILGDRDGAVLSNERNRKSKVATKDALLPGILGYPLHTHVGIDYVPSLGDRKTAWDFIHFKGFLDFQMYMQFSWHGCDSILAAPLVLDMVRLADLAGARGDSGRMTWLSIYSKKPLGVEEHDLHRQWHLLTEYLARVR